VRRSPGRACRSRRGVSLPVTDSVSADVPQGDGCGNDFRYGCGYIVAA
jgi:hypothetical protein